MGRLSKEVLKAAEAGRLEEARTEKEFDPRRLVRPVLEEVEVREEEVREWEGEELQGNWRDVAEELTTALGERVSGLSAPPSHDLLSSVFFPLIGTIHHFRLALQSHIDLAVLEFEDAVRGTAAKVEQHRVAIAKLNESAGELRDLKEMERLQEREREEWEKEVVGTVLELAKLRGEE